MKRAGAFAAVVLLALAWSARGVRAQDLEQVLDRFASAWHRGDAAAIARLVSAKGVSIEIAGEQVGPLPIRQAAAVLKRLFDDRETTVVRAGLAQVVGGSPPRAFGEVVWTARSRGTTESENATIFLALVRERDGWKINQIRLLR